METITVVEEPLFEPVSLAKAKEWCRVESTDTNSDAVIRGLLKAMREYAENLTFRAFVQRTLRLTLDCFPVDHRWGVKISLPQPPLVSVSSVQYRDTNGDLQTLDSSLYTVYDEYTPAFIVQAWNASWPSIRLVPDALQVNYVAGYPSGSPQDEAGLTENVPESLKLWMKARLVTLFDNREHLISSGKIAIPRDFADGILDSLIVGTRIA